MDATFYVYFSHQLYNAHILYLFASHTQGSTIVATVGSTLSSQLSDYPQRAYPIRLRID